MVNEIWEKRIIKKLNCEKVIGIPIGKYKYYIHDIDLQYSKSPLFVGFNDFEELNCAKEMLKGEKVEFLTEKQAIEKYKNVAYEELSTENCQLCGFHMGIKENNNLSCINLNCPFYSGKFVKLIIKEK